MGILIFGGLILDRYFLIDRYPERSRDGLILDAFDMAGGCAINMAKTIDNLGEKAYVVSYIGTDSLGRKLRDYVKSQNLPAEGIREKEGETGYCLVFLEPDGERTFLTSKGIEAQFSEELVPDDLKHACDIALVTGYYLLDDSAREVVDCLEQLKKNGYKVIFDPSPLVHKIDRSVLERMMGLSDILIPNMDEASYLAMGENMDDWALDLTQKGKSVLIKNGARGGLLYEHGKKQAYRPVQANAIDTTGAGDSFAGAIAYAQAKHMPLTDAAQLAAACASIVTTIKGPHGDFAKENFDLEIQEILAKYERTEASGEK